MIKRKKASRKKDLRQVAFTRFMLVVAFFVMWIGGISVRLVHLQVNQHTFLRGRAVDMRQDVKQTKMLRGTIYDRDNRALAMSLRAKTLYADPKEIEDIDSAAKAIGKALNTNAAQLATQLRQAKEGKKRFVPIARKADDETVQKINKALDTAGLKKSDAPNFHGLHWRDDQKRNYPYQTMAAQIVGFSNSEDDGRAGIELSQDDALHGAVIKRVQERDRLGRVYDETLVERDAPSDVVLTIDSGYQYMAEQALERGARASSAKSGMAIVMDPKTGEILALANYPSFDPNTITESAAENISNKAVQAVYSPGSVFKIVTYGSALEKRLFTPDDMIDSGSGSITIAKHTFTDSHGIGRVSYSQAMAHSSNVCAIKTATSVGREDFFGLVKKLGFGAKTGIELPGEINGIVRPLEKWNGDSLASMAIGYEIGVTALQMTSAFATIANNGIRTRPHIVKEIRHSNEQPKSVTQIEQTQVVTAETARNLRTMLRQVVLTGTGRRAQLNGYSVAGKTGTAWKFNSASRAIDSSKYISSFIGMAPVDDPRIVVAVVMDEPKGGARDGGMVSAPVFKEIAQNILTEMKVATDLEVKPDETVAKVEEDVPEMTPSPEGRPEKRPAMKSENAPAVKAPEPKIKEKPVKPSTEKKPLPNARLTAKKKATGNKNGTGRAIIET